MDGLNNPDQLTEIVSLALKMREPQKAEDQVKWWASQQRLDVDDVQFC